MAITIFYNFVLLHVSKPIYWILVELLFLEWFFWQWFSFLFFFPKTVVANLKNAEEIIVGTPTKEPKLTFRIVLWHNSYYSDYSYYRLSF